VDDTVLASPAGRPRLQIALTPIPLPPGEGAAFPSPQREPPRSPRGCAAKGRVREYRRGGTACPNPEPT
jgi:hypothetical protein